MKKLLNQKNNLKRILYILFIGNIIISCSKIENKRFYYPTKEFFAGEKKFDTLNFDNFSNFRDIQNTLWKSLSNHESTSIFLITKGNVEYYFYVPMEYENINLLLKYKNFVSISKDSIFQWERTYHINNLELKLKENLLNFGKNNKYADNPEKFKITFLNPEKESILEIKENIIKVFETYNKIEKMNNRKLQLNILFQKEPLNLNKE